MKYLYTAAALLAATVSADLCSHGSTDDNGNYYCQCVKAITYTGVGGEGSYNKVTKMDNGACSSSPVGYKGTLAPFDEEVSLHFRGPLKLKQFAFYVPDTAAASSNKEKRNAGRRSTVERRHAHGHAHAHLHHARDAEKRAPALGDMVTAVIDGVTQTWKNTYNGGANANQNSVATAPSYGSASTGGASNEKVSAAAAPSYGSASTGSAAAPPSYNSGSSSKTSSTSTRPTASPSSDDDDDSSSNSTCWTRKGYYNAEQAQSEGIVFLNHEGGSGSGVFDYSFGNSLSYASADGKCGASAPTTLENCQLSSGTEVVIMTDDKCGNDDSCGYYRDGTVAYHGFDGASKAFLFEFSMPDDGTTTASKYDPTNMPAIWLLNAQIPRTLQYGNASCSCWTTGCGEFDIFEVLAPGDKRCKSTLHGNKAGGDSDYFERPVDKTIKAVLLLYNDNFHIKILDDSTDFGSNLDESFVNDIVADTMADSVESSVSVFKLGS